MSCNVSFWPLSLSLTPSPYILLFMMMVPRVWHPKISYYSHQNHRCNMHFSKSYTHFFRSWNWSGHFVCFMAAIMVLNILIISKIIFWWHQYFGRCTWKPCDRWHHHHLNIIPAKVIHISFLGKLSVYMLLAAKVIDISYYFMTPCCPVCLSSGPHLGFWCFKCLYVFLIIPPGDNR